jgi:hypothetical protein
VHWWHLLGTILGEALKAVLGKALVVVLGVLLGDTPGVEPGTVLWPAPGDALDRAMVRGMLVPMLEPLTGNRAWFRIGQLTGIHARHGTRLLQTWFHAWQ